MKEKIIKYLIWKLIQLLPEDKMNYSLYAFHLEYLGYEDFDELIYTYLSEGEDIVWN